MIPMDMKPEIKVLTEVATALTNVFRKEDVIGRYGGDEFVVFNAGNL